MFAVYRFVKGSGRLSESQTVSEYLLQCLLANLKDCSIKQHGERALKSHSLAVWNNLARQDQKLRDIKEFKKNIYIYKRRETFFPHSVKEHFVPKISTSKN